MTMKVVLVLLVLCSGFPYFTFALNRLRVFDKKYALIEHQKNWCQAHQYCRKYYTDLVNISNKIQNQTVIKEGKNTGFWIGLLHDDWEWLDGGCSTFRDWEQENGSDGDCTIHQGSHLLYPYQCDNERNGLCSKGYVRIQVIDESLTWEQAFDYCEANHTGPLRIEDEEDQTAVMQWLNYTKIDSPFWIGLRQSRAFGFWL
ncbi:uncharacterized protein LOC122975092 [Thunnus albacares]|uniref:uncharacterized protein LOC122975092 n=1 Tax=Thunnus albacares TaxID=8236 RepID=UPI001CF6685C|nr:uncharacterized protein LOC122975092 [Thunnus albacares]